MRELPAMKEMVQTLRRTLVLCIALLPGACGSPEETAPAASTPGSGPGSVTLRVMSFNIEWGGTHVSFDSVAEAIRAARADIVGVQEPEGNLERLAGELGWYHSRRNHVISRFPLVDPAAGGGRFLFAEVTPGRVVAVASVHLPSSPSGTGWLREGRPAAEVAAMERDVRLPAIEPVLADLQALHRAGMPVFLTGDFNAPSHADWTEATVGKLPHRDTAFDWPVSRAVAAAGFRDSFRDVHPDPVARPGFTWWAGRPRIEDYNPSDPTRRSRIDYVWYAGPAKASESLVIGEEDAEGVDLSVAPWPSDHRAVLSVFEVRPAPMPEIITTGRRVYEPGVPVEFSYHSASEAQPTILLERQTRPGDVTPRVRMTAPAQSGTVRLQEAGLPAGHYEVSLLDSAGFTASSNEFWVLAEDTRPSLAIAGTRFAVGEPLPFEWSGAPGNRYDWIGIFPAPNGDTHDSPAPTAGQDGQPNRDTHESPDALAQSAQDEDIHQSETGDQDGDIHVMPCQESQGALPEYVTYGYVGARSSGSMQLSRESVEADWPVPPGRYIACLLADDGYDVLARSTPFTVTE